MFQSEYSKTVSGNKSICEQPRVYAFIASSSKFNIFIEESRPKVFKQIFALKLFLKEPQVCVFPRIHQHPGTSWSHVKILSLSPRSKFKTYSDDPNCNVTWHHIISFSITQWYMNIRNSYLERLTRFFLSSNISRKISWTLLGNSKFNRAV